MQPSKAFFYMKHNKDTLCTKLPKAALNKPFFFRL